MIFVHGRPYLKSLYVALKSNIWTSDCIQVFEFTSLPSVRTSANYSQLLGRVFVSLLELPLMAQNPSNKKSQTNNRLLKWLSDTYLLLNLSENQWIVSQWVVVVIFLYTLNMTSWHMILFYWPYKQCVT